MDEETRNFSLLMFLLGAQPSSFVDKAAELA